MRMRVIIGAGIWLAILTSLTWLVSGADMDTRWGRLWRYLTRSPQELEVALPEGEALAVGERVLAIDRGEWRLIGRVASTSRTTDNRAVGHLLIDPEAEPLTTSSEFRLIDARGDMSWAIETLISKDKMDRIRAELLAFREDNREELMDLAQIVARDFVNESITVINANLAASMKRHEKEWAAVVERHRSSLKEDLVPVLKEEMGPVVKERLKPVMTKIGRELWDQLPLWSVTWRSVADSIPYVRQKYMETWWQDFLDNKAIPIVGAHEEELLQLGEELALMAAENEKVRNSLAQITRELIEDPEFRALVNAVLHESLIEPFETQRFFDELFENPEFRRRFDLLTARFAPVMERIGRVFVENPDGEGLNPKLVEVVRRLFFEKQSRALLVIRSDEGVAAGPELRFEARSLVGKKVSLLPSFEAPQPKDEAPPVPGGVSGARRGPANSGDF